jgi:hypothetical protein
MLAVARVWPLGANQKNQAMKPLRAIPANVTAI